MLIIAIDLEMISPLIYHNMTIYTMAQSFWYYKFVTLELIKNVLDLKRQNGRTVFAALVTLKVTSLCNKFMHFLSTLYVYVSLCFDLII